MKKVMASLTLFSLGLLVAPVSVKAADEPSSGTTQVGITFDTADTTNVDPVDPDHPEAGATNPQPPKPNVTNSSQGLSLIYVSPQMNFQDDSQVGVGHGKINLYQEQSYFAKVSSKDSTATPTAKSATSPFNWDSKFIVEVADGRGAASNWKLNLSGEKLSSEGTNDKSVIDNATIDWPDSVIKTSAKPNGIDVDSKMQGHHLTLDNTQLPILTLKNGEGAGITTAQFNPAEIKLTIPVSTAKPGAYSTTLHWTLSNEALS